VSAAFAGKADKPNIVFILSDDQSWTDYGFMGHDVIRTPHLDKLASQSVVYSRAYVPTPLCRPSLMSFVTGHYAKDHGITGNDPSTKLAPKGTDEHVRLAKQLFKKIDRFDTLPEILGKHGYLSHQSGKWWEGNHKRGGFTHGMTEGSPGRGARHGDKGLTIGREGLQPIFEFIEMAQEEEKPFYIWYAPFLPHTPHNPPKRILNHYQSLGLDPALAKYYAMCEWFDETCGELVKYLDDNGLRDNTLIYYACDNGWIQRTADMKLVDGWKPSFAPRSKQTVYEGGARNPIMFSWPGKIKPDERSDLVSSIDTVPTVLSSAGIDVPEGLPGYNLWGNLAEGSAIQRNTIFGDTYAHDIADLDDPEASLLYLYCIRDDWKLILSYDGEVNRYPQQHPKDIPVQLYNLEQDPFEKNNLAGKHPAKVAELKEAIENWYPLRERKLVSE
jgi:uncharacterized sulfatase